MNCSSKLTRNGSTLTYVLTKHLCNRQTAAQQQPRRADRAPPDADPPETGAPSHSRDPCPAPAPPRPAGCPRPDVVPTPCPYRSWQQRCQSVNRSSACSVSEVSIMENFRPGTRDPIRQTNPTTPPISGQIPGFFKNSAKSPKRTPSGFKKPRVFRRLKIHKSAIQEPLPLNDRPSNAAQTSFNTLRNIPQDISTSGYLDPPARNTIG